jgi:hypothetical protein
MQAEQELVFEDFFDEVEVANDLFGAAKSSAAAAVPRHRTVRCCFAL